MNGCPQRTRLLIQQSHNSHNRNLFFPSLHKSKISHSKPNQTSISHPIMKFSTLASPISSTTSTPRYRHRHKIPTQENSYEEIQTSQSQESENAYNNYTNQQEEGEEADDEYEEFTQTNTQQTIPKPPESILSTNIAQPSANSTQSPNTPFPDSSSYINIAPLPIFRGESGECPVTHLTRFARVCRANNAISIAMKMRIFPVTLDDDAALWYELNIEPYPSLSWEEIQSSFLQTYRKMEFVDQLRSELMMIRQADGESIHGFFLRMQWILKKWGDHGIPDSMLQGIFIDGLREDFQDWVIPHKPNSIDEALRLALAWEQAQSIRKSRQKRNVEFERIKCGFCDGLHEERMCEIRRRMREVWLKSNEKEKEIDLGGSRLDKKMETSIVMGGGEGEGEGEDEKDGGVFGLRKSQCQCWKHQCWKKKGILTRNYSTAN